MPTPNPLIAKYEQGKSASVQPSPVSTPVLNELELEAETFFKKVQDHIMGFRGKKGYNPFLWWRCHVLDLDKEYKKAKLTHKVTRELVDKIIAIKIEDPIVIGENTTIPEQIVDTVLSTPLDVNYNTKKTA